MNRIYQLTRTKLPTDDDEATGTPTLHVAQDRQKLKVTNDIDLVNDNEVFATQEGNEILYTTDEVAQGDLNPVTSNAVSNALSLALPVGTILEWQGATPPEGYLFTDGSTFDADEYPELAEVFPDLTLPVAYQSFGNTAVDKTDASSATTEDNTYTAAYDGFYTGTVYHIQSHSSGDMFKIYVNNAWLYGFTEPINSTDRVEFMYTIPVKRGDIIRIVYEYRWNGVVCHRYYNQNPKIIKAR